MTRINRSICDTDAEKSAVDELSGNKARSAIPANATARMSRSRMQLKDPLDMSNPQYLEALKSRQKTAEGIDYLNDNIVSSALKLFSFYCSVHHINGQITFFVSHFCGNHPVRLLNTN